MSLQAIDPIIARGGFRGIRIGIADWGIPLEHIRDSDFCVARFLLVRKGIKKIQPRIVHTPGMFSEVATVVLCKECELSEDPSGRSIE